MKRTLISLALVAASSSAMAAGVAAIAGPITQGNNYTVCDSTVAGGGKTSVNGGPGAVPTASVFTRTGFEVQCSANVQMAFSEVTPTAAAVGAVSVKGNQRFGGHSNGGAIGAQSKCTAASCVATEAADALGTAKTAATATGT